MKRRTKPVPDVLDKVDLLMTDLDLVVSELTLLLKASVKP